ncbi:MAG: 50S ribosomal protein L31e [Candidatus Pacearchaeota archaeon]
MAEEKKQETKGEEREYTIPLRSKWIKEARYKKTNKAVKAVKEFLARHMKIRDRDLNKIKLDTYLNNFLWMRGIKNPPARVKVKAFREGDVIRVELMDFPDKIKFRKAKLDKRKQKSLESLEKKEEKKPEEPEEESKDKEKSGEEGKKEEPETQQEKEEKKASVVEAGKEQAKKAAQMSKHQTKMSKQPKQQQRKALKK